MNGPFSLEGKTVVVTGASSGLGRGIAITISQFGGNVILLARNEERLKETYQMLEPGKHSYYTLDLTDFSLIKPIVGKIVEENGKIDGLINAAGVESTVPLKVLSQASLEETFKVNVYAGIELTKHFSSKKSCNPRASVVFLSSVMGFLGEKGKIAYCGSKAAIRNMVKPLALELSNHKIRVNSISPAVVMTEMATKLFESVTEKSRQEIREKHPLGLGEVSDVANLCVYLLSNASKWVTGTDIVIDGGYSIG